LGPPESTTQTASRSVQPLVQDYDRDRCTDGQMTGRTYVPSTQMRPNNAENERGVMLIGRAGE